MRILLRSLLGILLLVIGVLVFVTSTQTGLRFAWRQIQPLLPVDVQVTSLHGSLSGRLTLRGIVYQDDTQRLSAAEVRLAWSPNQLWNGVLHVRELLIDGLNYSQLAPAPAAAQAQQPFALPPRINIPLGVRLDRLRITGFRYQGYQAEGPFEIDSLKSRARLTRDALRIEKLAVAAPLFNLSATAKIGTHDGYPLSADADWALHLQDYPDLAGHTRASGSLQKLTLQQTLDAPYNMQARAVVDDPFGLLKFDAEVTLQAFAVQALYADAPPFVLAGRLEARGSIAEPELEANLSVNTTGRLKAHAQRRGDSIDAVFDWTDIEWPEHEWPAQMRGARSDSGRLQVSGSLDDYRVSLQGAVDMPALTNARVQLAGRGDLQSLRIDELSLGALEGEIQGTAQVRWAPQLTTGVDLRGSALNPGVLLEGWNGRLGVDLKASAQMVAQGIDVQIKELKADGSLRDYPVRLAVRADYAAAQLALESFDLRSGASRLSAAGQIGDRLAMNWEIHSTDLGSMLPGANGHLSGSGSINGALQTPRVSARLEGGDLQYAFYELQSLALNADLDLAGRQRSSLDVQLGQGRIGDTRIEKVSLRGDGTPEAHKLELAADSDYGSAGLTATGSFKPRHWGFELTRGRFQYPPLAAWTLQAPVEGEVSARRVVLQDSCWLSGDAQLCAAGTWTPLQSQAGLRLERLPLSWFKPLLGADVELEGSVSGSGEFNLRQGEAPDAQLRLELSAGRLLARAGSEDAEQEPGKALTLLSFNPGNIHFDMSQSGMKLSALLPLQAQGRIEFQAGVGPGETALTERPLRGRLHTELRDLGFLSELIPQISRVSGRLEGNAALSGTLQRPMVKGRLALLDGGAALDAAGLELSAIRMQLSGTDDERILIQLSAESGGGTLNVKGETRLAGDARGARLDIQGENFKLLDIPEAQVFVSPALVVVLKGKDIDIQGEILVPEATIEPKKLPASAQSVSGDQVLVDQTGGAAAADAYRVTSRVRLILGDKVAFDGFGLTGRFTGNLMTYDEPLKPTTASGEIRILDGKYRAYGQNLDIRTGRLIFVGGPVSEPGIDLEAVRTPAPDILVGVRARGQLKQPDISVFSEPDMSQSNQVAWLVLGRPLETDSSAEERNTVNQAAIALGLGGGALLGKQFGETLGVDEITIESGPGEDTQQAALLVGKYLTPKLYITYGLGIFEPVSTLRLRYTISSKWRLLSETSAAATGADLFYVIERGK